MTGPWGAAGAAGFSGTAGTLDVLGTTGITGLPGAFEGPGRVGASGTVDDPPGAAGARGTPVLLKIWEGAPGSAPVLGTEMDPGGAEALGKTGEGGLPRLGVLGKIGTGETGSF